MQGLLSFISIVSAVANLVLAQAPEALTCGSTVVVQGSTLVTYSRTTFFDDYEKCAFVFRFAGAKSIVFELLNETLADTDYIRVASVYKDVINPDTWISESTISADSRTAFTLGTIGIVTLSSIIGSFGRNPGFTMRISEYGYDNDPVSGSSVDLVLQGNQSLQYPPNPAETLGQNLFSSFLLGTQYFSSSCSQGPCQLLKFSSTGIGSGNCADRIDVFQFFGDGTWRDVIHICGGLGAQEFQMEVSSLALLVVRSGLTPPSTNPRRIMLELTTL